MNMKKIILLFIIFGLNTNLKTFSKNSVENNIVKLTIVDNNNKEKLCGVTVINGKNKKYTNLDGEVYVDINKNIIISYISYKDSVIDITKSTEKIIRIKQK
jgi:hypothetical protein